MYADWTLQPKDGVVETSMHQQASKVTCPGCAYSDHKRLGKRVQCGYTNLRCTKCGDTYSAKFWNCTCGVRWYKCLRHDFRGNIKQAAKAHGNGHARGVKRKHAIHGVDKPLPKVGCEFTLCRTRPIVEPSQPTIRLRPGTKLAARFPHLVVQASVPVGTQSKGVI